MSEYRWNLADYAAGYDAAAEHIHPYYREIQRRVLDLLPFPADADFLLVDAGGGSGRFVGEFLRRFPGARALVLDQSEAFLALARQRLEPFGGRAACRVARLQDDWTTELPEAPAAIVSMSAIHHLDAGEKTRCYGRCHAALRPGGVLINADEVRPADDGDYLAACRRWAAHMHRIMDAGRVSPPMGEALRKWEARNVDQFGAPRTSGDDCHETVEAQLGYLAAAGFAPVSAPWQRDLWAILHGVKR